MVKFVYKTFSMFSIAIINYIVLEKEGGEASNLLFQISCNT